MRLRELASVALDAALAAPTRAGRGGVEVEMQAADASPQLEAAALQAVEAAMARVSQSETGAKILRDFENYGLDIRVFAGKADDQWRAKNPGIAAAWFPDIKVMEIPLSNLDGVKGAGGVTHEMLHGVDQASGLETAFANSKFPIDTEVHAYRGQAKVVRELGGGPDDAGMGMAPDGSLRSTTWLRKELMKNRYYRAMYSPKG